MPDPVPRVVIVGGGFGGLAAARALGNTAARVVLVDRENHHLFPPLLYQVAISVLSVFVQWVWTHVTGQRGARLIVNHHARQGGKTAVTS